MDELTLSIGDLARRTGVDIPTLRRWERYEGLLAPARTPGGQRRYGSRDVEAIEEVVSLVDRGWPPSSAAKAVAAHRDTGALVFDAELFDAVPAGVVITNADFEVLYANPHVASILGADPTDAEAAQLLDLVDDAGRAEIRQAFQELRHGHQTTHTVRVRTRRGGEVELEFVAGPLLGPAGRIRGAIAVVRDLGRRRAVQRELQIARQLLDAPGVALVALDRDGVVLTWNLGAESTFGVSADDAVGRALHELLPEDVGRLVAVAMSCALDGEMSSVANSDVQVRVAPLFVHDICVGTTLTAEPMMPTGGDPRASAGYQGVIATISQSLLRGDPTQTIVETAVEGVARSLGVDHVAFVELGHEAGEQTVLASTIGPKGEVVPGTGPFGSHVAFAVQSHRPIVVRDFPAERRFDRGPLVGEQAAVSGVCAPVRWAAEGEGALCVHSSTEHLALTSGDVTFVQSAANLCALALARGARA